MEEPKTHSDLWTMRFLCCPEDVLFYFLVNGRKRKPNPDDASADLRLTVNRHLQCAQPEIQLKERINFEIAFGNPVCAAVAAPADAG